MRRLLLTTALAALSATGPPADAGVAGSAEPRDRILVQAPAGSPDATRVMAFSWTLYPSMWAELDLRLAAGAEAVAEVAAEGGEVSWNLHFHPPDAPPTAFITLAQGTTARATVRCAPDSDGRYSYLFENDRNGMPIRLRIELRLVGDARLEAVKP